MNLTMPHLVSGRGRRDRKQHIRLTLGAASRLRPRRQSYPAGRPAPSSAPRALVPRLLPEQHAPGLVLPGGADLRSRFLGSLGKQPLNPRGILAATELDLASEARTASTYSTRSSAAERARPISTSAGSITVNFGTDISLDLEWFLHGRRQPTERRVTDPVPFGGTRLVCLFPVAAPRASECPFVRMARWSSMSTSVTPLLGTRLAPRRARRGAHAPAREPRQA